MAGLKLSDLKKFPTPCVDDCQLAPEDFKVKGALEAYASSIVLKCLWFARLTRPDLYWTINNLARSISKWSIACDKRLFRLICYLLTTEDRAQYNYCGDKPQDCSLIMFADASFAADAVRMHSDAALWGTCARRGADLRLALFDERPLLHRLHEAVEHALDSCRERRANDFVGAALWHHRSRSTEFFARWLEAKAVIEQQGGLARSSPVDT